MSLTADEFIPNAPNTGKIGTENDPWGEGHFSSLTMGGSAVAPLASPLFTGNPRGPTPSAGNNSTSLATTAYVDAADALKAPLASPQFTGNPRGVTAANGNNSTTLATTAYVDAAAGNQAHTQNTDTQLANGTANETSASDLRTHLDDATKHRQINDSGTGNTTLWSADKIAAEITAAVDAVPTEFVLANITDAGDLAALDVVATGNLANGSVTPIKVEGGVATPDNRTFWGKAANGTVGFHDLTSQVALRSVPTGANGTLTLQSGEMVVSLGTSGTTAAAGNDSRFPTAGEKAALAGSSGTPGANNTYVTEQGLAAHAVDITTDTAPELGGNLATAGFTIQFENSGAIADTSGNELLQFGKTASAVNHVKVTNAATGSAATISAVGDDTDISLNLVPKGNGTLQANGQRILTASYGFVWVGAGSITPRVTNGATASTIELATNDIALDVLSFGNTTETGACFQVSMPEDWDAGTIKAKFYWTAASGSGGVAWKLKAAAAGDDEALDNNYGTAQVSTDTFILANDLHITAATSAITIGNTPGLDNLILFELVRDVAHASDTLTANALLLGVKFQYAEKTTNPDAW